MGTVSETGFAFSEAIAQASRDKCDFSFKHSFLGIAPGSELLNTQSAFGQKLFEPSCH